MPLDKANSRLVAALRAARTGTWTWDIQSDRVEWDEPLAEIYGISLMVAPTNAAGFLALVHPDDQHFVKKVIEECLEQDTDPDYEFRTILPDGSIRWIYDRSKLVRDSAGRPAFMVGTCSDVTRRKVAERALIDSETRLELAMTAADLGIWDWDIQSNRIIYSEKAKAIYGFPHNQDVTFEQVRKATHPEDYPRTSMMAKRALDPAIKEQSPYEYRILLPDGSSRWVLAYGKAVFEVVDGIEKPTRYVGTIQDITKRHNTETSLRDSESRLRLAIDAGRMAVWEYIVASDTIVGSPELNLLLGFPEDYTPSIAEMRSGYYPGDEERVRHAGAAAIEAGQNFFQVEYRYIRKGEGVRWFLLRAEISLYQDKPWRVVGVLLDITDQKAAVERQRLLVNELNHRVKNTLVTVQSIIAQSLRYAVDITQAQTDIETRILALSRAHNLLTISGWEGANMADLIDQVVSPFVIDRSRVDLHGENVWLPPRVAIDLAMILHELTTNAVKYGALSLSVGTIDVYWSQKQYDNVLELVWREKDGPTVMPLQQTGFGSRLINGLAQQWGGTADLGYHPDGLVAKITFVVPERPGRNSSS